jgi:hypothetical protein
MIRHFFTIASMLVAASPAPALAQDNYYVRNDAGRTFTCGLRRDPNRKVDRFVLRRGTEATRTATGGRQRTLLCDTAPVTQRYRMRPGIRYALVREDDGLVVLRRID